MYCGHEIQIGKYAYTYCYKHYGHRDPHMTPKEALEGLAKIPPCQVTPGCGHPLNHPGSCSNWRKLP